MSIKSKFLVSMLVMSVVVLVSFTVAYTTAKSQEDDGAAINLSGRQRMLSQRMSKEALMLMMTYGRTGTVDAKTVAALELTRDVFGVTLNALTYSGEAPLKPARDAPTRFLAAPQEPILGQLLVVEQLWIKFQEQLNKVIATQDEEALAYVLANNMPLLQEMDKAVRLFQLHSEAKTENMLRTQVGGLILFMLVMVATVLLLTRKVFRPLLFLVDCSRQLARGNLGYALSVRKELDVISAGKDELGDIGKGYAGLFTYLNSCAGLVGEVARRNLCVDVVTASSEDQMGHGFQTMVHELNRFFNKVKNAAETVDHGAAQIAATSQNMSTSATTQAASLEEINASMTMINSQTKSNAENAGVASELATEVRQTANRGSEEMASMMNAMNEISESSEAISKIIKTIDEIAFQTNLLALNAAVEAARAGSHGKGFAVVAEEVRSLAGRSSKAAHETAELIEGSVARVKNGNQIALQTSEALNEIVAGVGNVADLLGDIARSTTEQSEGLSLVNQGLSQVEHVVQESTASVEEAAAASVELSNMATNLKEMIEEFQVKSQEGTVGASFRAETKTEALPGPEEYPAAEAVAGGW